MLIKLIPETDEEKERFKNEPEVVYEGVKDYFMVGVKTDADGDVEDFHDWRGQHRFLLSNLHYFYEIINDERREQNSKNVMRQRMAQANTQPSAPPSASAPPKLQVVGNDDVVPAEVVEEETEKVETKAEPIDGFEETKVSKEEYRETTDD